MFDVGFWEVGLVALVSLLVIGPERLPKAARIAGYWVGKSRNIVNSVKAEIKEELQAEEMRQIMQEQTELHELHQAIEEGEELVREVKNDLTFGVDTKKKNNE